MIIIDIVIAITITKIILIIIIIHPIHLFRKKALQRNNGNLILKYYHFVSPADQEWTFLTRLTPKITLPGYFKSEKARFLDLINENHVLRTFQSHN